MKDLLEFFEPGALPDELLSVFEPVECLSENTYGSTYLMQHKTDQLLYAVKSYSKKLCTNPAREGEILKRLSHPGIPRYAGTYEDEDCVYIVREYVEGQPLDRLFVLGTDEYTAVKITKALCDILTYLHTQSPPVIHRDIKPSNIIVSENSPQRIKLIDFGISREYTEGAPADTECMGTNAFAAPEQYGFRQTDARTDIYALGVVLCYMLTGSCIPSESLGGITSRRLRHVVRKCTELEPRLRYKSSKALQNALSHNPMILRCVAVLVMLACLALTFVAGIRFGMTMTAEYEMPAQQSVVFAEPIIENAVRVSLGKEDHDIITEQDLLSVNNILIVGTKAFRRDSDNNELTQWDMAIMSGEEPRGTISSLEDIAKLKNLMSLQIYYNMIEDLSSLAGHKLLQHINLKSNVIYNVSPLAEIPNLNDVALASNPIRDFSLLQNISLLKSLDVSNTPLMGLEDLGHMPRLTWLNIARTSVRNLSALPEGFPMLENIYLMHTPVTDFSPIEKMPLLQKISIDADMQQYISTQGQGFEIVNDK